MSADVVHGEGVVRITNCEYQWGLSFDDRGRLVRASGTIVVLEIRRESIAAYAGTRLWLEATSADIAFVGLGGLLQPRGHRGFILMKWELWSTLQIALSSGAKPIFKSYGLSKAALVSQLQAPLIEMGYSVLMLGQS